MKRDKFIKLLDEIAIALPADSSLQKRVNDAIDEIKNLTVRIELSVLSGVMQADTIQATTNIRVILDTVDHDDESFEAGVDGYFLMDNNVKSLQELQSDSIAFGDELRGNEYEDRGAEL